MSFLGVVGRLRVKKSYFYSLTTRELVFRFFV